MANTNTEPVDPKVLAHREAVKRYRKSPKGRENHRACQNSYRKSAKGQAFEAVYRDSGGPQKAQAKYRHSEKGRERDKKSRSSPKAKVRLQAWAASEKGKRSLKAASQRLHQKRRAWTQEEKLRRGCTDCGYNRHAAALDFDHVDAATKRFDVSKTMGRSKSVMIAEIAKCVVRCSNCHRIKTYEDRQRAGDKRRIKG